MLPDLNSKVQDFWNFFFTSTPAVFPPILAMTQDGCMRIPESLVKGVQL